MSGLRRLVVSDRFFFVTCRVMRRRKTLEDGELEGLARVVRECRAKHGFLLTAWVFLPDHWHAIFFPRTPLTIAGVMEPIKVGSTLRINRARKASGLLWQPRFFDPAPLPLNVFVAGRRRALRSVKEYHEKVAYIHENPVRAGLVERAEDWAWSSVREYTGTAGAALSPHPLLSIGRLFLPANEEARI